MGETSVWFTIRLLENNKMSEHKSNNKGNRWKRFRDWAKQNSSFTDWCIALFTLVLAVAAVYQFIIMGGQLDEMRKDQRPW